MIYPKGHPIQWRTDIPPRQGSQTGTVARDWHRFAAFPWILWDDAQAERQELPECVKLADAAPVTSLRNAWAERSAR